MIFDKTRKMLTLGGLVALLVAALLFPAAASAQGALTMGPLKLKAQLAVGWEYRDNIFLTENNEVDDNIWLVEPTIGVLHDLSPTSRWSLQYNGTYAWYQDNGDNDWQSHVFSFDSTFGGKTGFYVNVADTFVKTSDPFGSTELYRQGQQTERMYNVFKLQPGYRLSTLSRIEVRYAFLWTDYDLVRDQTQNQNEHQIGFALFYGVLPKASATFEYRYVTREYPDQPSGMNEDFARNDFLVGLTWDPTAKLVGEILVGYSTKDYDNAINKDGYRLEEADGIIVQTNLTWKATERFHVIGGFNRILRESTVVGSNYYFDTMGTLGVRWWPIDPLAITAWGGIGTNEYNSIDDNTERSDDIYKAYVSVEYSFLKYLFAMARYQLEDKDSNIDGASYTDNRFYLGIGGRI